MPTRSVPRTPCPACGSIPSSAPTAGPAVPARRMICSALPSVECSSVSITTYVRKRNGRRVSVSLTVSAKTSMKSSVSMRAFLVE